MDSIDLNKIYQQIQIESEKQVSLTPTFRTRIISAVFKDSFLKAILDAVQPQIFENEGLNNEKKSISGKDVIIIEHLLQISDSIGLGLGIQGSTILLYNLKFWTSVDDNLFKTFLSQVAIKCGVLEIEAKKVATTDYLFAQFEFAATLYKPKQKNDIIKINLENGTLCMRNSDTGEVNELKPHDKEDLFRYQLSFPLDSDAKAPLFMKYLDRVLPDKQSQNILFEYLGYIFTNDMKLEKVLILYGPGSNGKSVLFEIISALFGRDNISHFSMESICNENGYYRAQLSSKLVNYASEFGGKLDFQILKIDFWGTCRGSIPYKEPITIEDYCKFILMQILFQILNTQMHFSEDH